MTMQSSVARRQDMRGKYGDGSCCEMNLEVP